MTRHFLRIPGVTFERPWVLGPARFVPSGRLRGELEIALTRPTTTDSMAGYQQLVSELLETWGRDAALEITADDLSDARRMAEEAMAILRFYLRPIVSVNVELHRIGLVGELPGGVRNYVVLWDRDQPLVTTGWQRIGGTLPFSFTESVLDAWVSLASVMGPRCCHGYGWL